jgi:UDP-sugar transporter A1/2/3
MLLADGKLKSVFAAWRLRDSLAMAGFPALIYSVQNVLAQVAYQNLDGVTFNVINQTKTIFAAICLYFVMGQRQSIMQCASLVALFGMHLLAAPIANGPAASLVLSTQDAQSARVNSFELGIVPVFAASVLSGLAQALSQKCLQV